MDLKALTQKVIGDKEAWLHTFGHGWRLLLIIIPALILWKAFFVKDTTIHVGKGGTAIINQSAKKFFIPFIEGSIEQRNNSALSTGIRAGLRFEF